MNERAIALAALARTMAAVAAEREMCKSCWLDRDTTGHCACPCTCTRCN